MASVSDYIAATSSFFIRLLVYVFLRWVRMDAPNGHMRILADGCRTRTDTLERWSPLHAVHPPT